MNSEYGGISASMGDKDVSWCFRFLTNELRLHEKICGYIYTELQDIEWEHNGFMNYDRTVKEFGYDYRMINAADMVIPDAPPGQTLAGGTRFDVDVYTSHFSDSAVETPTLRWRLDSVDCWGADHEGVDSGSATIAFTPFRVELARRIGVTLPRGNHLCALHIWVEDVFGSTVARNFTFIETFDGPLSEIDAQPEFLALRFDVKSGTSGGWASEHAEEDILIGVGSGYREYVVEIPEDFDLSRVEAVEVWAELSAGRGEAPQTESARLPGHVRVALNGTGAVDIALANAPADTRGALSYLRGSPGRYGELIRLIWSEEDMTAALASLTSRRLALRLEVDASSAHPNGLAIYGARAGRFPVQPCVVFRLKT
jgi:hypothetical protein